MALIEVAATNEPLDFAVVIVFPRHWVMGNRVKKGNGNTWHINSDGCTPPVQSVWATYDTVLLCQCFVGYRTDTCDARDISLAYGDRICKTCLRIVESRARARGLL